MNRFVLAAIWVVGTVLVLFAVFACPAFASGDSDYLAALHARGITSKGGDADMVQLAHGVCMLRENGVSEQRIIDSLIPYAGSGVSVDDVKFIVQESEAVYCPVGTVV